MATPEEEEEKRRRGLLGKAKDFGASVLGAPARLGEAIGGAIGEQKYGTGISAGGEATGRPYAPGSIPGGAMTSAATGVEALGAGVDAVARGLEAVGQLAPALTGNGHLPGQAPGNGVPGQEAPTTEGQAPGTAPISGQPPIAPAAPLTPESVAEANQAIAGQPPQAAQPPQGGQTFGIEETKARLGGGTLNEYLNAPAGTPGVSGIPTDAQGRMVQPGVGIGGQAPQGSYAAESAAREARAVERAAATGGAYDRHPDARTDRAPGELSMADATALTGGDRDKARALVKQSQLGTGEFAPKEQLTPQQQEAQALDLERKRQVVAAGNQPNATKGQKLDAELQEAVDAGHITEAEAKQARRDKLLGKQDVFSAGVAGEAATQPAQAKAGAPAAGTVKGGYRFIGGDPNDKKNWQKV